MRAIDPMSAVKRADELFHSGWNCAESVFVAIHEQAGEGQAPVQLLTALGGGMGCKRTCGALSGATVALGIAYGRTRAVTASKDSIVGQLGKLRAGWQPAHAAIANRRAGCHPAPQEAHLSSGRNTSPRPATAATCRYRNTR